jgi:hypothetical protein
VDFDAGLALQVARQLRQRGVGGFEHPLAQQVQLPDPQSGQVAAAVRPGRETFPGAVLPEEAGHRPADDVEDVCHVIQCAFAALVG